MNDLQTLRAALDQDDPAQEVVDRSRHRLQNRMRGGRSPRRTAGWLTVGTGLTVAAAAAVAITTAPGEAPAPHTAGERPATTAGAHPPVAAEDVLLAAATAAERTPDGSGTYWYVKVTITRAAGGPAEVYEYWTMASGRSWFAGEKTGGRVTELHPADGRKPFSLVGAELTLPQLRALPTEPVALKAWIEDAVERGGGRTSAGPFSPEVREIATLDSLISLVSTLPAPPAVRAAAFRAIAAYPGVESLGGVPGGQGLLLPGDKRLVVDPATGRVNGSSFYVTMDGGVHSVGDPEDRVQVDAEWTERLPGR